MRLLILVFGASCITLPSAMASESVRAAPASDGAHAVAEKKPDLKVSPAKPHFRCAKKIVLGPDKSETACLMKKRNAYATSPGGKAAPAPQRDMGGREQEQRKSDHH
jgi:hypothetical protein